MIYVITAYRWGSRENHSYTVGVFDSLELAWIAKRKEEVDRGGKYDCEIEEWVPNAKCVKQVIGKIESRGYKCPYCGHIVEKEDN